MVAHPVLRVKYNLSTKNYIIFQIPTRCKNLNTNLRWQSIVKKPASTDMLIFSVLLRRLLYGQNHKLGPSGLRQMIFAIRYARKTAKICQTSAAAGFFTLHSMPVSYLLFLQKFLHTFEAYFKCLCYLVLFVALLIQAEYVPANFYSARLTTFLA